MIPGEDCPDCPFCGAGLHEAPLTLSQACSGLNWNHAFPEVALVVDVECPTYDKPSTALFAINMNNAATDGIAKPRRTKKDERYLALTEQQ